MCYGTAPNGIHWFFAQPQHTGTMAAIHLMHNQSGISTCGHGHWGMAAVNNATFGFVSIASPFKRLLSGYFYAKQGGYHGDFQEWVRHRQTIGVRSIWSTMQQPSVLNWCVSEVGPSLESNLRSILSRLGYRLPDARKHMYNHCLSSCNSSAAAYPSHDAWYDAQLTQLVLSRYAKDFSLFGFSLA